MNQKIKLKTTKDDEVQRIDSFLAKKIPSHSRSHIQKLIRNGNLLIDGKICKSPKMEISPDSDISITVPEKNDVPFPEPEKIPLDIIYEDNHILVLNKQCDMVVHPADGNERGTIVNGLLWKFANLADTFEDKYRPGIVHRLDKDTTGCLIVAKNQEILELLIDSFKENKVEKTYLAIVSGHLTNKKGSLQTHIGRHPVNRKKMSVLKEGGKNAITHYKVIKEGVVGKTPISLLEVRIETGRTHQIRIHLSSIKKPVLGDKTYGGKTKLEILRQMLHAWKISIPHPVSGRITEFISPVPEDMQQIIDAL